MRNHAQKSITNTGTRLITITPEIKSKADIVAQDALQEAAAFDHLAGMLYLIDVAMTDSSSASSPEFQDHLVNVIRGCQLMVQNVRKTGAGYVVHDFISSLLDQPEVDLTKKVA